MTPTTRPLAAAAALSVAAGLSVALAALAGVGQPLVERSWDLLWPAGDVDGRILVVTIDQASLEEVGNWPWSDAQQAELLSIIAGGGAAAVGYDVLLGTRVDPSRIASAIDGSPTVVARGFSSVTIGDRLTAAQGEVPVDPTILASAAGTGHTAVTADADGVVRTVPLVVETSEGDLLPSLALAVAAETVGGTAGVSGQQPLVRPGSVGLPGLSVRTEPGGLLRVAWAEGLAISDRAVISAADVLTGRVDPRMFDGAAVLVGVTAPVLGDRHIGPLQPGATTPGVIVQAQALSTILSGSAPVPLPAWASGLATALLCLAPAGAAVRSRLRWAVVWLVGALVVVAAGTLVLFGTAGLLGDVVRVPLAIAATTGVAVAWRSVAEAAGRRETVDLFSRYVPERVARDLLASGRAQDAEEGVRLRVAVLFCDLRGFTPFAASLDPPVVRAVLDAYYAEVCEVVFANDGTVMQFVGDEVFAVFGAPEPLDDPVTPAMRAATTLLSRAVTFRSTLSSLGLPEVRYGIGLHAGEVVATHVGPRDRRQYAVVGDAVNVGSRLCGLAGGDELLASSVVVAAAGDHDGGDGVADSVRVKGKTEEIAVVRFSAPADLTGRKDDGLTG